jgi:predicted N-acetyltransferase YhbS
MDEPADNILNNPANNENMEIAFRQTKDVDYKATENITREAFWDLYKPGCDEHLVLHKIRKSRCYVRELDLVAADGERIIGHIICSRAKVIDSKNYEHIVLCVGPFSIIADCQKKGYGSKLLEYCIAKSGELRYPGMLLFGNPDYYHRFGFRNAAEYNIMTRDGMNFDPFMAMELQADGLKEIKGKFYEDESYITDPMELAEFEKHFPDKEKHVTPTQLKI